MSETRSYQGDLGPVWERVFLQGTLQMDPQEVAWLEAAAAQQGVPLAMAFPIFAEMMHERVLSRFKQLFVLDPSEGSAQRDLLGFRAQALEHLDDVFYLASRRQQTERRASTALRLPSQPPSGTPEGHQGAPTQGKRRHPVEAPPSNGAKRHRGDSIGVPTDPLAAAWAQRATEPFIYSPMEGTKEPSPSPPPPPPESPPLGFFTDKTGHVDRPIESPRGTPDQQAKRLVTDKHGGRETGGRATEETWTNLEKPAASGRKDSNECTHTAIETRAPAKTQPAPGNSSTAHTQHTSKRDSHHHQSGSVAPTSRTSSRTNAEEKKSPATTQQGAADTGDVRRGKQEESREQRDGGGSKRGSRASSPVRKETEGLAVEKQAEVLKSPGRKTERQTQGEKGGDRGRKPTQAPRKNEETQNETQGGSRKRERKEPSERKESRESVGKDGGREKLPQEGGREKDDRMAREKQAKERETRDREAKEKEERERETKEKETRERDAKEKEAREREAKEKETREREAKEKEARGKEAKEKEARERKAREREAKEREAKEKETREREAKEKEVREREAKEKEAREREAREREVKENVEREREAREKEANEQKAKEAKEKEAREKEAREKEAQEKEWQAKEREREREWERERIRRREREAEKEKEKERTHGKGGQEREEEPAQDGQEKERESKEERKDPERENTGGKREQPSGDLRDRMSDRRGQRAEEEAGRKVPRTSIHEQPDSGPGEHSADERNRRGSNRDMSDRLGRQSPADVQRGGRMERENARDDKQAGSDPRDRREPWPERKHNPQHPQRGGRREGLGMGQQEWRGDERGRRGDMGAERGGRRDDDRRGGRRDWGPGRGGHGRKFAGQQLQPHQQQQQMGHQQRRDWGGRGGNGGRTDDRFRQNPMGEHERGGDSGREGPRSGRGSMHASPDRLEAQGAGEPRFLLRIPSRDDPDFDHSWDLDDTNKKRRASDADFDDGERFRRFRGDEGDVGGGSPMSWGEDDFS